MKIVAVRSHFEAVPLTEPYTIASATISVVDLGFVEIISDQGLCGVGSAAPAVEVTGESPAACREALSADRLQWLVGRDPRHLGALTREVAAALRPTPAAAAAVDIALHDLFARILGVPLVDLLGRCHQALPTSVTIGICSPEATLSAADEYIGHGFTCLKVKIGGCYDEDQERLHRLRERVGREIVIRVDGNQGYSLEETRRFARTVRELEIELVEQPMQAQREPTQHLCVFPAGSLTAASLAEMASLPPWLRRIVAADESLHSEHDALALAAAGREGACGIFNIKLMKCGGIRAGLAIARIAQAVGIELMWGCNDESLLSITAAGHVAYACPNTRYLDLDGSFDLARDLAQGGMAVVNGCLELPDQPGLGVGLQSAGW